MAYGYKGGVGYLDRDCFRLLIIELYIIMMGPLTLPPR